MQFIDDRLNELETEKQELTEYEQLDKNKRALEYMIYESELSKTQVKLQALEELHEQDREIQNSLFEQINDYRDDINKKDQDYQTTKAIVGKYNTKIQDSKTNLEKSNSEYIHINQSIDEYMTKTKLNYEDKVNAVANIKLLKEQKLRLEEAIALNEPVYNEKKMVLDTHKTEYEFIHNKVNHLYNKQGMNKQFKTKKERDVFLSEQIRTLQRSLETQQNVYNQLDDDVHQLTSKYNHDTNALETMNQSISVDKSRLQDINMELHTKIKLRNESQEKRKLLWKDNDSLQEEIVTVRNDLSKYENYLNSNLPKAVSLGLKNIEAIVAEFNVQGYYGPLIDNFTLKNDVFQLAIEKAIGNALFHIIVDNDETAAFLIKELEKRGSKHHNHGGRLTFLPLNRLRVHNITYPDSRDVRPLLDVACEYNPQFTLAMKQVFNRKLLVRDLNIAAQFSQEYDLDCITRDGDVVNRQGGFEGGYHDDKLSKFHSILKIRHHSQLLQTLLDKESQIASELTQLDNDINELCRTILKLETEKNSIQTHLELIVTEYTSRTTQNHILMNKTIKMKSTNLTETQTQLASAQTQLQAYRDEMKLPLLHQLTGNEKNELRDLTERERELKQIISTLEVAFLDLSSRIGQLQAELNDDVIRRLEENESKLVLCTTTNNNNNNNNNTQSQSSQITVASQSSTISTSSASTTDAIKLVLASDSVYQSLLTQRKFLETSIQSLYEEISTIEASRVEKITTLNELEKDIDTLKLAEKKIRDALQDAASKQDKYLNKRTMLLETISNKSVAIRDLGVLPRKEITEYEKSKYSEKILMKKLSDINESLKGYGTVNKKALDQYISFNQQKETLIQRQTELIKDNDAIQLLMNNLDLQKDESILRTFRDISTHFAQVFKELVPNGQGQLVMKTRHLDDHNNKEGDEDEEEEYDLLLDENNKEKENDNNNNDSDSDEEDDDDDDVQKIFNSKKQKNKKTSRASKTSKRGSKSSTSTSNTKKDNKTNDNRKSVTTTVTNLQVNAVSSFTGVQIRVSFTGTNEMIDMQALSGGQKALVALALIFAIQRCDPAPFYLFDEIDQALDATYRKNVAALIQKQVESGSQTKYNNNNTHRNSHSPSSPSQMSDAASDTNTSQIISPTQFITTTFRPELVAVANQCYGIALQNKVSNIYPLDKVSIHIYNIIIIILTISW